MSSNDSLDDKRSDEKHINEKHEGIEVSVQDVDTGAMLASGNVELDPVESLRVRKKIDRYILPLMCGETTLQPFLDKTTLGSSAILGIKQEAHLSTSQYVPTSSLGTVFYLSYLVFEFPQNLALQRFPVAKWMSINIFVWAIALSSHAACKSFASLMVVRVILGMCEGSVTAGFMIVTAMFYTRKEQTVRVGYWFLMNGVAQIMAGFISFGTLHITTSRFEPWQWLMIICGALTFIVSISFWFFFPDSPASAWFLTPPERAIAILRIKANQTGLENKHFKKEQMIEALTDPKTWLFALFSGLTNIPNRKPRNQKPLIVNSFGFTVLQTTLLTCVDGVIEIITIGTGVNVAARTGQRAYTSVIWKIPELLGAILINALPWSNKIGLLFSLWITGVGTTGFVISIAWVGSVTAGHTKRVTTNAIMLIAYCIGNAAGPFMWIDKYKPRNRIPWIIIGVCYITCMAILLLIRYILATENKRRDAEPRMDDAYDNVYVERLSSEGVIEKVKVDREFLDLTDRQNRDFRYVL
ncbi:major facilitator superfamily domain-containing protein [Mycena metata]|uniref:Major facilitator superfamily domain-containing protein n=1 Tax=Mycena metata TaxID=1033252 RepID=A0AAD7K086_9AGAR|nr:major facilitator superfamily domain-containing protein [Mycena metata]